jgi:PBSX family phage terminase large subunit
MKVRERANFVNQAAARCSVEGSKYWFNCNPGSPSHWFKLNWLDVHKEKNLLHLHFTMDDNPSLSEEIKDRFKKMWKGVFFQRYILGLWVMAEGAIYDMFSEVNEYVSSDLKRGLSSTATHYIAVDYGTQNATVFLYIIWDGETALVEDEYYYSGKTTGRQKTDSEYGHDLEEFLKGKVIPRNVIIDPSAASFKAELKSRYFRIKDADNDVLDGIRMVGTMFNLGKLKINKEKCPNTIREIQSYVWDPTPTDKGNEKPLKKDDHCPDALRYFVKTIIKPRHIGGL